MSNLRKALLAASAAIGAILALMPATSLAMPSFARQTGMNCNSCHIGTDSVPNFTRTGRLFAMHGYTRPYVRERIRADGQTVEDMPQYGGQYIALNWTDFFAARFVSDLWNGGKSTAGVKSDNTSRALSRMTMFFTGAITDWLGLWTEIGYLGNNSLNSVTTGRTGPTGLNFFAYDEYRLAASFDYGKNSFWGVSIGNENPDVVGQWDFPLVLPDMWYNGQGGVGRSKDIFNISLHTVYDDRWWLQVAAVTGGDNTNWSNGWNQYFQVMYNFIPKQSNDLWAGVQIYRGNDFPSIMSQYKDSFICPGVCPTGVTDSSLSIVNAAGFTSAPITNAPLEVVDKFNSYKVRVDWARADVGDHTYFWGAVLHGMKEDFKSGGKVERVMVGTSIRYFWRRTYGIEAYYRKDTKYKYTTPAGDGRGVLLKPSYGMTFLWNPAMNFSTHFVWSPKVQNTVFEDQSNLYQGAGKSYSLGFEYAF
jgi:hypothetical protein